MTYAEDAAAVSGREAPYGQCNAKGCTMPGSLSASTTGGSGQWYCRVHFGMPVSLFDSITARIANRRELYRIAIELSNDQSTSEKVREQIRALGRKEFLNNEPGVGAPSAFTVARRIYVALDAECRMPQAHMGAPAPGGAANWLDEPELSV